ncbi:hypothetical protein [Natronocalculus amylovorans]|uniref:Uncharacterized protein n=1 Tax=Natronocalculus amylovorans TaxID=2917812 RepID=A0AAE3FVY3_9EURY|nr:hypothetical protein [Natronocalculus amylovorans]MCL9815973.1 hypothetical protein [Natronocalculus amylovorans]
MWSSELPTGTVSPDRTGDRTYPLDPSTPDGVDTQPYPTRSELTAAARDRSRAVREANQLRTQVSLLRDELDRERTERRQVVERYEYLLADVQRTKNEPKRTAGVCERIGAHIDAAFTSLRNTVQR